MKISASEALAKIRIDDAPLYCAASPGYPCNFSRDSIIYARLAEDVEALEAQIAFSASHQGKKKDPQTGEEPGKIHHEIDLVASKPVEIDGLDTTYNACDTTALFLESLAFLAEKGRPEVLRTFGENIEAALGYIHSHIGDNHLFKDDSVYSGAANKPGRRFALKVTYWKDSVLNAEQPEPEYPIVYTLPHFQNSHALRAIGRVMDRPDLLQTAQNMEEAGIKRLWHIGHFITAIDGESKIIDPPSSDSLHALLFVEPAALPPDSAASVEDYMIQLETGAGYRTGIPVNGIVDRYHTDYVWTHEQALLHEAALKHKLPRSQAVARRILAHFNGNYPELIDATTMQPAGNPIQLWAIGSRKYFG